MIKKAREEKKIADEKAAKSAEPAEYENIAGSDQLRRGMEEIAGKVDFKARVAIPDLTGNQQINTCEERKGA